MKLKRLLTGVLSAVMALSVCAMPAAAADATNKQVTFDPTRESGSLTIMKYEQSEEQKQNNKKGDLLGGVTFKAYLLATIKQTEDNGNINLTYEVQAPFNGIVTDEDLNGSASYIDNTSKMIDSKKLYDELMKKSGMAAAMASASAKVYTETTGTESDNKGKAVFKQLPLGIYLIEEADAPNQIVTKSASFIVSIPRVDVNGAWQYDVTAEPKNVGVYGGVTLTKTGRVAGDTGEGTGIAGVEFLLEYKNTKNNDSWDPVDLSKYDVAFGTQVKGLAGHVKTGADGVINIKKLTHGEYRFTEISAVNGYIADTNAVYEFRVTETGAVQVKQQNGDYVDALEGIKVINERPDFDKDVTKRGGTTSTNNDADYGVGDMVPYTLTIKVPQGIGSMKTFAVTDTITPTQLEYQKDVVVTGTDKNGTAITSDNYKVTYADGGSSFTVDFKPQNQTDLTEEFADQTITIKYTAKLLSGAAITSAGNVNKAELVYSNKTSVTGEETPDDKNTIHDEGVIYTFRTAIQKTDPDGMTLDGVSFVLYKKYDETDGTIDEQTSTILFNGETCNVITGNAAKKYGLTAESKWIEVKSDKTANQGNIMASGIPCGEYYWVETETLNGYNLLKDPVKADLTIAYEATWKTSTEYVNNVMTKHQFDKTENYDDTAMATPITVVNRKGFTLPVTGGFGTLLFSGIGVLLVLAGVCVLFSMKKKNNRA